MEDKNKLPKNYIPLIELNICSNKFMNGGKLIEINNFPPLLIGDGIIPLIWIYIKGQNDEWVEIINESFSLSHSIQIIKDKTNREIIIGIDNTIVLKGKMTNDKYCEINILDLRPIGFDIHGNEDELKIVTSSFSKNTFMKNGIMFNSKVEKKNIEEPIK